MGSPSSGTPFVVRCASTVGPLRSTGISRINTTMDPSDFRPEPCVHLCIRARRSPILRDSGGSPRFLGLSFGARHPLSPRTALRVHLLIASTQVADFAYPGRLVAVGLFNEAETGSLVLRLTPLLSQASPPRTFTARRW